MNLQLTQFKNINLADPFFDSLKADYKEFPDWFARKAEDSAYVFKNGGDALSGFLYLKIEEGTIDDVTPPLPRARRIKVGTLKIDAHGTRLGERFLKKIFDHAIVENVKKIYVTVFGQHAPLVALFQRYGFQHRANKITQNGTELVLVRDLQEGYVDVVASYPLVGLDNVHVFLLSVMPKWHTRLLPDSILRTEHASIVADVSHTNSIHKVYLAAMRGMERLKRGDVLLIYRTSDDQGPAYFRSVATSICVVEEYRPIHSFASLDEFMRYCSPYSVFTPDELKSLWERKRYPHVVRFTYNIALRKRVTRGSMAKNTGLDIGPDSYWGFMPLSHNQFMQIARLGEIDESLIVHQA